MFAHFPIILLPSSSSSATFCYGPWLPIVFLHSRQSLAIALPVFLFPLYLSSYSTSPLHLLRDLPLFLVPSIISAAICFGVLWFCSHSTWPYHLTRRDFINVTISSPCNMSFPAGLFLSIIVSFFYRSTYFSSTLPFKYSEHVRFFSGTCPSFWHHKTAKGKRKVHPITCHEDTERK